MNLIEFTQKLLRIQSITPRDMGCFDLIEPELKELGFSTKRINYLNVENLYACLLYTSPSPRDVEESRMPSSA